MLVFGKKTVKKNCYYNHPFDNCSFYFPFM